MLLLTMSIRIYRYGPASGCESNCLCARLRNVKSKKAAGSAKKAAPTSSKPVSLKELAEYLSLSPATVSLVINRSPVADSIPQQTKDRVFAAVKKYKYRPNLDRKSVV